jgi:glucokinase
LLDRQGVLLSSVNLLPLEGINLRQELAAMTGLPVAVLNDANAAALGEKCYGAGRSYSSLLLFTLGTGVGSGLILDGRLWTGSDGVAAEYGHATVEPLGHLCPCGNRGCLEQYASATALLRMAKVGILDDAASTLATLAPDELDASAIAHAARGGDQLALACFAVVGHYLGIAAATIVNLLNLDAIIIAGGVSASFDLFADELQEEIRKRAFALPAARVKVLKGELGDDAGLLGAAAAAWDLVP